MKTMARGWKSATRAADCYDQGTMVELGEIPHVCSYDRVLCAAGRNAFQSSPLGNGHLAFF